MVEELITELIRGKLNIISSPLGQVCNEYIIFASEHFLNKNSNISNTTRVIKAVSVQNRNVDNTNKRIF